MASNVEGKEWLENYTDYIVKCLNPVKVVRGLRKMCPDGFDARDKDEILLKYHTPRERSEALLELLLKRTPEAREAFRQIIMTVHPHLGTIIQPVQFCVLWLSPSAVHAAMVVYVLERFAKTEFFSVEEGGPGFLARSGFAFGRKDVLIKLVFPVKPELFSDVLAETVQERRGERMCLAVLTGVCDALVPGVAVGQAVIPTSASEGGHLVHCHTAERLKGLQAGMQERLDNALWQSDLTELYKKYAYMDYYAACLGRLYAELMCAVGGHRSVWLEQFGWGKGGVESERNRTCLAMKLPDWDTGQLAKHVLKERQTWKTNPSSPLGLAPKEALLSRIKERKGWYDEFPSVIGAHAPSGPVFNPLSAPGGDGDVTDTNTHMFYEACFRHLGPQTAWLACECVCHDAGSSSHELTAFTAVTMAMEVVQLLIPTSTD